MLVLAFGANRIGAWGPPEATILRALRLLRAAGVATRCLSPFYSTASVGPINQPRYLNAIGVAETRLPAMRVLAIAKRLELAAGRRPGPVGGPRPLDIDIIDFGGCRLGWPPSAARRKGGLVLPHPQVHLRRFVVVPLADVAPYWRHPVTGRALWVLLRATVGQDVEPQLPAPRAAAPTTPASSVNGKPGASHRRPCTVPRLGASRRPGPRVV